jgi:hypothetical protein
MLMLKESLFTRCEIARERVYFFNPGPVNQVLYVEDFDTLLRLPEHQKGGMYIDVR